MANWDILKSAIAGIIKTNGNQEITGRLLQNALNNIVSSVGENATFAGIATPDTNPGVPDGPVFYLAGISGVYSNFGVTLRDEIAVIANTGNGSWTKSTVLGVATTEKAGFMSAEDKTNLYTSTLLCASKIKDTYIPDTLNINKSIHVLVPKGKILVKISIDKPISSDIMYCYYKINENKEKFLGQINKSEQFLEKTINLNETSKLSIRYSLTYSMGYTIVTELQTDSSFADSIARIDSSVENISDYIKNNVVTYKEIEPTEKKEGYIDSLGSFNSSSVLKVNYYPVNVDKIYKVTTSVSKSGLYPFHFYDENGLYLGHTGEQDLIANEVFLDVPAGAVLVAINAKKASAIKLLEDYGNSFEKLQNEINSIKVPLTKSNDIPISSTAIGFINAYGSVNTSITYINIDYYNIEDSSLEYLCSSKISGEDLFIVHFYDKNGNYLGHAPAKDSNIENYKIPEIPAKTSVIAINRLANGYSQLMSKVLENESIPDKITELENWSLFLKGKILVGFGDSITQLKDSKDNSYLDYISQNTGITTYNAGVAGSALIVDEECVFIEILTTPTSSGIVEVKGAVRAVSFTAELGDSIETLASKLYEAFRTVSSTLAYSVIGAEVCVKNWSGFTIPIQTNTISVETDTGVKIRARKNAFGMFETFKTTYIAYKNLDIPQMVHGLTTGDWRCQKLAAQYLQDNSIVGFVDKISALESLNVTDLDIVTIAGGTNNYANVDFGDISSNYTKVAGGMKEIVNMLLSAKKDLKVCFFTPIPRYFGNDISNWDDSKWGGVYEVYVKGSLIRGNAMPMLIEAITNTAKQMCIPVYDMYYSMGWNKWNFSQFFNNTDGTHPSKGLKWMGDKMTKYLLNLL